MRPVRGVVYLARNSHGRGVHPPKNASMICPLPELTHFGRSTVIPLVAFGEFAELQQSAVINNQVVAKGEVDEGGYTFVPRVAGVEEKDKRRPGKRGRPVRPPVDDLVGATGPTRRRGSSLH